MKRKARFFKQLFLIGALFLPLGAIAANNNPLAPYESFLEPEDDIIITEKTETITYSRNSSGVSANLSVKTKYMNRRFGSNCNFQIYYNEEDRKIENIKGENLVWDFSSNLNNDNIFFDGLNVCNGNIKLIEVGDKASFQYDLKFNDVIYLASVVFAESRFIGKFTLTVEVPAWLEMDIKEFNFNGNVTTDKKETNKKTIYSFTMNNVRPIKNEKHKEPSLFIYPNLLFVYKSATLSNGQNITLFNTAQDQYKWYDKLMKQTIENTDSLCSETKKITANCKDKYEKIATIYQWVQKNIRYIAFENGIAGFKPQNASKVLDNKYGDCKGMANLLRSMLRCEGIDSRMVWIGTNDLPYNYSTPSLAVDNHAICAAILGKDTIFLDATCEYAALKEYPSSIAGRPVMLEDQGKCILTHVPANRPKDNLDSTFISMKLTDKGVEGVHKKILRGEDKILFLYDFKDDFTDIVKKLHNQGYEGLPTDDNQVTLSGISSADKEVVIEYPFAMESPITKANNKYYVSMDIINRLISMNIETEKRKNNLYFDYKAVDSYTAELVIPNGYKVTHIPANLTIDKDKYKFEVKYTQKGGKIIYTRSITIKEQTILQKDLDEWNKDIKQLKSTYMETVVLEK